MGGSAAALKLGCVELVSNVDFPKVKVDCDVVAPKVGAGGAAVVAPKVGADCDDVVAPKVRADGAAVVAPNVAAGCEDVVAPKV